MSLLLCFYLSESRLISTKDGVFMFLFCKLAMFSTFDTETLLIVTLAHPEDAGGVPPIGHIYRGPAIDRSQCLSSVCLSSPVPCLCLSRERKSAKISKEQIAALGRNVVRVT